MKTREELLAIIEPLYAATPMHFLAVNFIVDFLLIHPSVAVECIRETPVLGHKSKMYTKKEVKQLFDTFSESPDLYYIMDGYYSGVQGKVIKQWLKDNLK